MNRHFEKPGLTVLACTATILAVAADSSTNSVPAPALEKSADAQQQTWNWHVQNTDIVQGDPGFSAKYSGPNSLKSSGEMKETVSLDLFAGIRLWPGAEAHVDGLMWQGFGLSKTLGVDGFPFPRNGNAFSRQEFQFWSYWDCFLYRGRKRSAQALQQKLDKLERQIKGTANN